MSAAEHLSLLQRGRWFGDLDDALQRALVDGARVRSLRDGERLFSRGDPGDGLYAVVDGALCITATSEGGRELMLTRMEPPTWFGEISVIDGQPRTHDVVADGESQVVHVPSAALDALFVAHPRLWRDLAQLAVQKLRLAFSALEDVAALPLRGRLARRLLLLGASHGERVSGVQRVLGITQEQLASMVQASRQSVNQAVKELEARGLIRVAYGQVTLLDVEGLKEL